MLKTPSQACKPDESTASEEVINIDKNTAQLIVSICMLMVATIAMVLKIIEVARSK